MKKKKLTAGESMIASAKQALAFARGEKDHGCVVHTPEEIAARKKGGFLVAANSEDGLEVPVRASGLDTTERLSGK